MLQAQVWERHLLDLAHEALESEVNLAAYNASSGTSLQAAYHRCRVITSDNSRTFFMASNLLPPVKRRAVQALYAFCRVSDDLVDRPQGEVLSRLEHWRQQVVHGLTPSAVNPDQEAVALAWTDTRRDFCIPGRYVEQLIEGISSDVNCVRYETFSGLAKYCYRVACTVGLMSMHIVGYTGREAVPYAIRLGVALQLTNILRDVGEDWANGRLYLPQEELDAFGVSVDQIAEGVVDHNWRNFMRFQISRARQLYAEALPGVAMLGRDGRFAIAAAGELYRGILSEIESNDYDVFRSRASMSTWNKLSSLPGIWWRSNVQQYS
jgi:15-cis-phytoene synthase